MLNKLLPFLCLLMLYYFYGCGIDLNVSIHADEKMVLADDNFPITTYELKMDVSQTDKVKPKAVFFYIQGSEYESVLNKTEMLASTVILGARMIIYEKRGVNYKKINLDTCYKYSSKQVRVEDGIKVINEYLKGVNPLTPVILIGGSEGGDVASVIASRENRITHLILLGSGGGLSQETELKILLRDNPGYLGLSSEEELNNSINQVFTDSNDMKLWLGHTYRRWKSYLRDSSLTYLKKLNIPIALLHGNEDKNVPVSSAREIKKFFDDNGKTNLTYIEYKSTDHRFYDIRKNVSIYSKIEVDLVNWLYKEKIISSEEKDEFIYRIKDAHPEVFK